MDFSVLTINHYEELLDRSWRRCGNYCYRPLNESSCCPCYPLSTRALDFEFKRSLRKCVEKMNLFLETGSIEPTKSESSLYAKRPSTDQNLPSYKSFEELSTSSKARDKRMVESCCRKMQNLFISRDEAMRRIRVRHQMRKRGVLSLEDSLYPEMGENVRPKHKLVIETNYVSSEHSKSLYETEHEIIVRYQNAIHKEDASEWTMMRFSRFLIDTPLVEEPISNFNFLDNEIVSDKLSSEICDDSIRYLVRPPPVPTHYGTYHCHYFLDGQLIAVGVLDVLPKYLTTVYFFYEPGYSHLNLGIYSALTEISMIRRMNQQYAGVQPNKLIYYHMGYFVPESLKMRYKLRFRPSSLLCSETHSYVETNKCLEKLHGRKYAKFADFQVAQTVALRDIKKINLRIRELPLIDNVLQYIEWARHNFQNAFCEDLLYRCLTPYSANVGQKLTSEIVLRFDFIHSILCTRHFNRKN